MKKKLLYGLFFCLGLVFSMESAHALRPYEITGRDVCPHFELALAKGDGTLEHQTCHQTYEAAKKKMMKRESANLVIIENGVIIDAKYAVVDYDQDFTNASTKFVRIYKNKNDKVSNYISYIRTAPGNYADDAVLLDYDYETKRAKIKISGIVGWIDKNDNSAVLYDVVPLIWTKSLQYYSVTEDRLYHVFPKNIYGDSGKTSHSLDLKPDMLEVGNYYSYDGHYFYTDMKDLIDDYKNDTYEKSVNKDNPYYNYYQYLSYRTKTNYNADNINAYINFRTGNNVNSKLYNTGQDFIKTQEKYGVNAILMLIVGINESSSGTSTISKDKNNLFGLGAVDSDPYNSAETFETVGECIDKYGYKWLTYGFLQPGDWRFEGAILGDKSAGVTVHYASDPFWGETAAHYYFEIDSRYGFQDRNNYLLAVNTTENVYPKKSVGGEAVSSTYYKYENKNSTVVVLETIKANDGNLWYKIQSDPNLDVDLNYIGSSTNPIDYNWNSYVYVEAKDYILVSHPEDYDPKKITDEKDLETNKENNESTEPTPTATPEPTPEPTPTPTPEPVYKQINNIVTDAKYKYNEGVVTGIKLGTKAKDIISSLTQQGAVKVVVIGADGKEKDKEKLATGDKIEITTDVKETLEVVIFGDINGDSSITAIDYVMIKNHIMGTQKLKGVYKKAADYSGDDTISAIDYVKIKNYIMNK